MVIGCMVTFQSQFHLSQTNLVCNVLINFPNAFLKLLTFNRITETKIFYSRGCGRYLSDIVQLQCVAILVGFDELINQSCECKIPAPYTRNSDCATVRIPGRSGIPGLILAGKYTRDSRLQNSRNSGHGTRGLGIRNQDVLNLTYCFI